MSLIKCPGCNSYISELETNCPNCNFILTEEIVFRIRAEERKELDGKLNKKKNYAGMSSWMAYRWKFICLITWCNNRVKEGSKLGLMSAYLMPCLMPSIFNFLLLRELQQRANFFLLITKNIRKAGNAFSIVRPIWRVDYYWFLFMYQLYEVWCS